MSLVVILGASSSCAKKAADPAPAATAATGGDPKAIVDTISTGVKVVGAGLTATSAVNIGRTSLREDMPMALTSAVCTNKGAPVVTSGYSDANYPGYYTYCTLTVQDGNTVAGGFDISSLGSCLIKEAGLSYDGVAHVITFTDALITTCGLGGGSGVTAGMQMTITPSAPASFNTNYANGAILVLDSIGGAGLTFKVATNVVGTKKSFITSENWTDGHIGTTAGSFDTSTGDLWYEAREERDNCTTKDGCGWNRHTRLHALMKVTGNDPTGLVSLTFAHSEITFTPGQSSLGGLLVTASGALATGIKARLWTPTHGATVGAAVTAISDYSTVANWIENTNTKCYTASSETATGCGTGLAGFTTSTKFALNTTDSHTTVAAWLAAITGQTFTNVDVDADTQF